MELFEDPVVRGGELADPVLRYKEPEIVYDVQWYPAMHSSEPASCLFAATSKSQPVHLYDAYTGALRSTYASLDQYDELDSAFSIAFDPAGKSIYCGFEGCITVFDVARPGPREYDEIYVGSTLSGIISCINFSSTVGLYALGSFNGGIALFSQEDDSPWCVLPKTLCHPQGVSCIRFGGEFGMYSCGRRDKSVVSWDLRNLSRPLGKFSRLCQNGQRMYFDVDSSGQFLVTGSQTGEILIYSTDITIDNNFKKECADECLSSKPLLSWQAASVPVPSTAISALSSPSKSKNACGLRIISVTGHRVNSFVDESENDYLTIMKNSSNALQIWQV